MKTEHATALIAHALIKEQADLQPKALAELLKIPVIQVHNVMNKLSKDGIIEIGEEEKGKTYTVTNPDGLKELAESKTPAEPKHENKVEAPPTPQKKQAPPKATNRHTRKFIYKKVPYSKSMCALMVVTDHVETHKPSLKELVTAFPMEIVSRFGVVNELKAAQDLSKDRSRYHMKSVLTTSDGKLVVVTNQWSQDRFLKFCEAAEKLGYIIKPE